MKIVSIILFVFFSIGIINKINVISFIKKIKCPAELSSSTELDDESKGVDDDDQSKERDSKEELEDKNTCILTNDIQPVVFFTIRADNHLLSFYNTLFKSHFKEVVTPPPELV